MHGDRMRSTAIALLRPPVVVMPHSLATHGPTPPLGIAYIAASLRQAGYPVQLVDGAGEAIEQCVAFDSPVGELHRIGLSPDEIADRVAVGTDLVGITNMFLHEWPQVRALARAVRRRFPDAFIVVGGENATSFGRHILVECEAVDCCVLGEGEATMLELAARREAGSGIADLPGVMVREAGAVVPDPTGCSGGPGADVLDGGLPVRIRKQDLGSVPRPAWDLVPLHNYWARDPFFGVNRGRSMQVLGTRGCPYQCTFCSSPRMWTTKFVVREPDDVVDEIASYVERYGVENVNFVDLTAATNRRWTIGLCDALERRALGITWQLPVGTRVESIDREVLQRLWDTGCRNITFAPESGSPRMLEVMNKRASIEHVLESVRDAKDVGLHSTVNIIVGHPEERWSDSLRSLGFLAKAAWSGGDDCAVIMFCPYPGSVDYDHLVDSGRHVIDEASHYVGLSRSSSSHQSWNDRMSPRQVRLLQLGLICAFYLVSVLRRPRRIFEFVRSQVTGREDTYLDQMVRTRRKSIRPRRGSRRTAAPAVAKLGSIDGEPILGLDGGHLGQVVDGGPEAGSIGQRIG